MNQLSPDQIQSVVSKGYRSPVFFCQVVLDEWYPNFMPWVHRGILAILTQRTDFLLDFGHEKWRDDEGDWDETQLALVLEHFVWRERPDDDKSPTHPVFVRTATGIDIRCTDFTLVLIPRGFGKTTVINGANLWAIVYKMTEFLVYISKASEHAEEQLQGIKLQLESNQKLLAFYGNLVPDRMDTRRWRSDLIETLNGVILVARGIEGQIRGLVHNGKRPDKYVLDDVEDEKTVETDEQRKKVRRRFYKAIRPGRRRIGKRGRFVVLATMLHPDDLSNNLKRDPQFTSIILGSLDNAGNSLWPLMMPLSELEKEKMSYAASGELNSFYLEFHNQIRSEETAIFRDRFVYQAHARSEFVSVAMAVDPAISDGKRADHCTFAVVGERKNGTKHVLECLGKAGMHPAEQVETYFRLHFDWDVNLHGVESIAYQRSLEMIIREEMFRKGKEHGVKAYFEILPLAHRAEKKGRIKGLLAPLYRSGYITHQRRFPELETQLLDFPNGKDDYPDALAMAVSLLMPYAALSGDEEALTGNAYKSLEFEIGEMGGAP